MPQVIAKLKMKFNSHIITIATLQTKQLCYGLHFAPQVYPNLTQLLWFPTSKFSRCLLMTMPRSAMV